jgi:hypothetical protein
MFSLLSEIFTRTNNVNLKISMEIEIICKKVALDVNSIEPSSLLVDAPDVLVIPEFVDAGDEPPETLVLSLEPETLTPTQISFSEIIVVPQKVIDLARITNIQAVISRCLDESV